jgi:ribosomal protein S20
MTKINKSITSELHSIIKKCITNNIDAKIQKLGNDFLNAQQVVVQFATYLVL